MKLQARDCSPIARQPERELKAEEVKWLGRLAKNVQASNFVVPISGERDEDESVVYCERDGTWWAGRYVGSISFEGHSLTIEPRFGLDTLRSWLAEATSVMLADSPGELQEDQSFIVQLLASVWAHGFVEAARHGLPALRREVATRGAVIKGRIDVPASLRLIAVGGGQVVSIRSERLLNHAASDAIVAAYQVLRRWIGVPDEKWLPARARELLPHLMTVTGARPPIPTKAELDRIRYTPITAGFARIAELSRQIANRRGLSANIDAGGETKGVLLDVAELWELYVLSVLRKAAAPLTVIHGTREKSANKKLLHSDVSEQSLGTLIPDAILFSGSDIRGVVDAKYKRLHPSVSSPNGPQRDDLYQMAAYLGRFQAPVEMPTWGLLAYPFDPQNPDTPVAELNSPWSLGGGGKIGFATLPHSPAEASAKLRDLLKQVVTPIAWTTRVGNSD